MASCKATVCLGKENICKNCIKVDVCEISKKFEKEQVNEMYIEDCEHFKDRNRFVELPCKFLQKCFVIPTSENKLFDITEMECNGFALSNGSFNANLITEKNKLYQPGFGAFGKTVFLTREEAERALNSSEKSNS